MKNRKPKQTAEETRMYQAGLADSVQEREPLTSVLVAAGRQDLQVPYIRGWLSGERLTAGVNPLTGKDDIPDDGMADGEGELWETA